MNIIFYKILDVIILTIAWLTLIGSSLIFIQSLIASIVFLFKGNADKFYDFSFGLVLATIVFFVVAKGTILWRAKTVEFRDENDKSLFD